MEDRNAAREMVDRGLFLPILKGRVTKGPIWSVIPPRLVVMAVGVTRLNPYVAAAGACSLTTIPIIYFEGAFQ